MKKTRIFNKLYIFLILSITSACGTEMKKGEELSNSQLEFISSLGILGEDEEIILFDSQGYGSTPEEISGNFFTNKRIASYWIDDKKKENTSIESSYYSEIDTIWRYPKFNSWTLASYLEVHRTNGSKFKVYIDADSTGTWNFFNLALKTWNENKARNKCYECMGFYLSGNFVGIGKSATSNKFEIKRGYVREERLVHSNPHSS